MINREKVINGLVIIKNRSKTNNEEAKVLDEAIALLKEQDAKALFNISDTMGYGICPVCGRRVYKYNASELVKYCSMCGQAVKWE